jgi:hypothetical protein
MFVYLLKLIRLCSMEINTGTPMGHLGLLWETVAFFKSVQLPWETVMKLHKFLFYLEKCTVMFMNML